MAANLAIYERVPVTIAAGQSLSPGVMIPGQIVALEIQNPQTWATANLTFQGSSDFGAELFDSGIFDKGGTELNITIGALANGVGRFITLTGGTSSSGTASLEGIKYLRIRSGTAALPVVQTVQQVINVITRVL